MKAAGLRARHMLVVIFLVSLLALVLALVAPVTAQEETTALPANKAQTVTEGKNAPGRQEQSVQGSGQQAEGSAEEADAPTTARAADTLQGAEVTIESSGDTVERIEIATADCNVDKGATVTVKDENEVSQTFTNIGDVTAEGAASIKATEDQLLITDIERDLNNGFGTSNIEEVTDSAGITCGRDDGGNGNAANEDDENGGDETKTTDDLEDLSCDDLLVLFRAESSGEQQYFSDADVRAQIEVCLKEEIVKGTAADEDLPDTGGVSLLAVAVLGVVSAAAGLSVIRGGRK